jgi:phage-related protein (TIGR01555 family)
METNQDDYKNLATGLAGPPDKSRYGSYRVGARLSYDWLNGFYEGDSLCARVVDRLVDDATREPFNILGTGDYDWGSVHSDLEDLGALEVTADTWRWARLQGGCLMVMAANDGHPYDQPLDLNNVSALLSLETLEAQYATPGGGVFGYASGKPTHYDVAGKDGKAFQIHPSRVIRIDGVKVPSARLGLTGWGPSVIQRVYGDLMRLGQAMGYSAAIMHDMSVMILKMPGLRKQQAAAGSRSRAETQSAVEGIRMILDSLHVMLLDSDETYEQVTRDLGGLDKLIDKFVDAIVRATDMPRTIVLGESPGGLNASSDSEMRGWFDHVAARRKQVLTAVFNRLLTVLTAIRRNRGEKVPDNWTIEWGSLWQPTAVEQADTLLKGVQAMQIAVQLGIMTAAQAQAHLVSKGLIDKPVQADPVEPAPALAGVEADVEAAASVESVPPDLISVEEAALLAGVPTRTMTNMLASGSIPYWLFGSKRQVSRAQVIESGRAAMQAAMAAQAAKAAERAAAKAAAGAVE